MSRASGASFAQFFPAAPKAAKERAKERVKSKSQSIESPVSRAAADIQVVYNNTSRTDDAGLARPTDGHTSCADAAPALAEDNESLPGDILNGVGSASSHSSTVSSVFSAPAQPSTILNSGTAQNVSSLTPLTNIDSSPNPGASPGGYKSSAQATNASGFATINSLLSQENVAQSQPPNPDPNPTDPRIPARDPTRSVKGDKCVYDPLTDRKLSSNERKKAKAKYVEFGLVRIHKSAGERHLLLRMAG